MSNVNDMWHGPKIAQLYKKGEELTKAYATALVQQAGLTSSRAEDPPLVIFDNACGTGVVSSALYEVEGISRNMQITCGDTSESMVSYVQQRIKDENWLGATAKLIDAQDTNLPRSTYSHVLSNFGFVLVPKPDLALNEMYRILKPGGIIGFTSWQEPGWHKLLDIALSQSSIPFPPFPPISKLIKGLAPNDGSWDSPDYCLEVLQKHGFAGGKFETLHNLTYVRDAEEFCTIMKTMLAVTVKAAWSEEEAQKFGEKVPEVLREYLDGEIGAGREVVLVWKGYVFTGMKPKE